MQSLRDKLLKAGLVSEEQAKKAEAEPASSARPRPQASAPPARRPPPRSPAYEKPIPALPPMVGSKAHQRLEAMKQLALDKELRELVLWTQVEPALGTHAFHFVTRKGKLRRLDISDEQAKQLEAGELAVVERQDPDKIDHALVPASTAEKLLAMSAKAVRFFNRPGAPVGFTSEQEPDAAPTPETGD